MDKARAARWHPLSAQEWLQLGRLAQRLASLLNRLIGTCIQWRSAGVIEQLMSTLHEQAREQVKKA
ncbi:MAG: hypothetical protein V7K20_01610 [Nostoc sp.]